MNDDDVTHVTRNKRDLPPEVKLVVDVIVMVGTIYYLTHPDCLDTFGELVKREWKRVWFTVSVGKAQHEIRSLPEVDD